jgi:hypothetical protein
MIGDRLRRPATSAATSATFIPDLSGQSDVYNPAAPYLREALTDGATYRVHSTDCRARFRRMDVKRAIHLGRRERGPASAISLSLSLSLSLYSGRAANFPDDKSL